MPTPPAGAITPVGQRPCSHLGLTFADGPAWCSDQLVSGVPPGGAGVLSGLRARPGSCWRCWLLTAAAVTLGWRDWSGRPGWRALDADPRWQRRPVVRQRPSFLDGFEGNAIDGRSIGDAVDRDRLAVATACQRALPCFASRLAM